MTREDWHQFLATASCAEVRSYFDGTHSVTLADDGDPGTVRSPAFHWQVVASPSAGLELLSQLQVSFVGPDRVSIKYIRTTTERFSAAITDDDVRVFCIGNETIPARAWNAIQDGVNRARVWLHGGIGFNEAFGEGGRE